MSCTASRYLEQSKFPETEQSEDCNEFGNKIASAIESLGYKKEDVRTARFNLHAGEHSYDCCWLWVVKEFEKVVTMKTRGAVGSHVMSKIHAPKLAYESFIDGKFRLVTPTIGQDMFTGADVTSSSEDLPNETTFEEFQTMVTDTKTIVTAIKEACSKPGEFQAFVDVQPHIWEYENGENGLKDFNLPQIADQ